MRHRRSIIPVAIFGVIGLLCAPGFAQNTHQPVEAHPDGHELSISEEKPTHETGEEGPSMGSANQASPGNGWREPVMNLKFGTLILEQLENQFNEGTDAFVWDAQGWYGGDYHRFWFKTEGELETQGDAGGEAELQLLYSRLIAPFWDVQAGLRVDQVWGSDSEPSRVLAVIGFQGLAPYRFEVEPTLFISEDGDISARLTATMDLLMTQKLILQPMFETEVASRNAEKFGVGKGLEYVELGLRLRYEFRREFAPYIGIDWSREFGETADLSKREGNRDSTFATLIGVRLWF